MFATGGAKMAEINRVSAVDIRDEVVSGSTLLVCAYGDDAKFRANKLADAISLSEFKNRLFGLDKNTKIVFYCA
jgi:hypothetical protein